MKEWSDSDEALPQHMRTNLFLRWLRKTFCCFQGHNFFISTSSYQSFLKIYLLRESLGKLQHNFVTSKMRQCRTLAHVRCQKWQREYEIIELNYTASWMIITCDLYIRHSGVLYTGCFTAVRVRPSLLGAKWRQRKTRTEWPVQWLWWWKIISFWLPWQWWFFTIRIH